MLKIKWRRRKERYRVVRRVITAGGMELWYRVDINGRSVTDRDILRERRVIR